MQLIPVILCFLIFTGAKAQSFKKIPLDSFGVRIYDIESAEEGSLKMISSVGLWSIKGRQVDGPSYMTGEDFKWKRIRDFSTEDGIRAIHAARDSLVFYATHDNIILFYFADKGVGLGIPPFIFPPKDLVGDITSLWSDNSKNLFIGCKGGFYFIKDGANKGSWSYKTKFINNDSDIVVERGGKEIKLISLSPALQVNCFAQLYNNNDFVWIGTNSGLYRYSTLSGNLTKVSFEYNNDFITSILPEFNGDIWYGTEKNGLAFLKLGDKKSSYFSYDVNVRNITIKSLRRKTKYDFFVAVKDSLPAVFNKQSHLFNFINDSSLSLPDNNTTDIETDITGNLFVLNDGKLFFSKTKTNSNLSFDYTVHQNLLAPFIRHIELLNGEQVTDLIEFKEGKKTIELPHDKNSFFIHYDVADLSEKDSIRFSWTIKGYMGRWVEIPILNIDSSRFAMVDRIPPGSYEFVVRVRVGNETWRKEQEVLHIIIHPPYWKTWWFWTASVGLVSLLLFAAFRYKVASVRKHEREKAAHEKELLELEARALRAQMNPHFIYNCLNSIKALIQNDDKYHSIEYLTTFSKLMRTLFHNSDKRQISLYDEIECCKLYTKLEAMRLNDKLQYDFELDPNVDLKSIMVPALIIQPFIENAIWHGLVPKEGGQISVRVKGIENTVTCEVEDDGIGREMSRKNKPLTPVLHESKGVHLSQARIDLQKKLTETDASIEIIDKYDQDRPTGTRVILSFNLS